MSRYLGKLLIKSGKVEKKGNKAFCEVKYIRSKDRFEFRSNYGNVKVDRYLCFKMADLRNNDELFNRWSIGYRSPEKEQDIEKVREKEINYLCGSRRQMFMDELVDSDSDFDLLCVIMSEFCVSSSILLRMSKSKWNKLKVRVEQKGRKLGSKKTKDNVLEESEEEFKARIAHNKRVSVEKGLLAFYLEACKEECERMHMKYDKDDCVKEFLEKRKEMV